MLVGYLSRWLPARVCFGDHRNPATLRFIWQLLGHSDAWVDILTRLQIRFESGALFVAEALEQDDDVIDQITACLLHLWKFRSWSESRWCGVGVSSRALMGCLMCGLEALVVDIMQEPDLSKYWIQGFGQLNLRVKKMMVLVSCAGRVSENFLQLVLQDDRLPKRIVAIDEQLRQDAEIIEAIPTDVLDVF